MPDDLATTLTQKPGTKVGYASPKKPVMVAGRHQLPLATMGAIMGGNVRVGLEDSLFIGKGQLAQSNADQVRRIRTILENLSLEVASPKEARAMLSLKGGDQVAF